MSQTELRAWRSFAAGTTVSVAVTTSSQFLDLTAISRGTGAIRVANIGTQVVFLEEVENAGTAASITTSIPILPNTVEAFTYPKDKVGVAVIATATGSSIYITPGEGL